MISKFLDPKNDFAFKKIFGTVRNKKILMGFLNDILDLKHPISKIKFLKTIQDPEIASKKTSIVDVYCKDESGRRFIVEMQVASHAGFEKRAPFYAANAYIRQLNQAEKYKDLKEVIFLAIANFEMFPNKKDFISHYIILDEHTHENYLKDFSFTFLELPKFHKKKNQLKTPIDKWLYFFKHASDSEINDSILTSKKDSTICLAYKALNRAYWDEAELNAYEDVEKKNRDLDAAFDSSHYKGEKKREREIVQNMILNNLPNELISQCSGLSIDEIQKIRSPSLNKNKTPQSRSLLGAS